MKKTLSKLQRVPLREAWKHEAGDFTPWLAERDNLTMLADELGLAELELVAVEHWVGDFKLDILCSCGDEQIIIENQLEKTNHAHLGQIITYAAGIGAKKVIWVAESFRPEHLSALEFLNQNTTDELNFFGVEIELWRIGDSPLAPKFEAVVKPNEWSKTGREQARAASASTPTKQLQLKFWGALEQYLATKAPYIKPQKPRPRHWFWISIGRSGFGLSATTNQRDNRLGVEVYINHPDSKAMFDALLKRKEVLEGQVGCALDWQDLPDAHACRIAVYRDNSPLQDEHEWQSYLEWLTEHIVKLNTAFKPAIQSLS